MQTNSEPVKQKVSDRDVQAASASGLKPSVNKMTCEAKLRHIEDLGALCSLSTSMTEIRLIQADRH